MDFGKLAYEILENVWKLILTLLCADKIFRTNLFAYYFFTNSALLRCSFAEFIKDVANFRTSKWQ